MIILSENYRLPLAVRWVIVLM